MKTILGIDPGSRITGFGIINFDGKNIQYIASGCIRIKAEILAEKLQQVFDGIREVIFKYKPEEAAIEQVFMHQNVNAALKLGQARGAAIVAASIHTLPIAEYSARQVKQAVVGYGGADKKQIQHMIQSLLSLSKAPQVDAADALAVAICHAHLSDGLMRLGYGRKIRRGRLR